MEDRALWQLMWETKARIEPCYLPAIEPLISESKLSKRDWGILFAGLTFEPEATTPAHLMVRGPYTAADQYTRWLSNLADKKFLEMVADGQFRLAPIGRELTQEFIRLARQAMAGANPLKPDEARKLVGFLDRLVDQSLHAPPPPGTWSIHLSHKLMPVREPALPFIEQALSCLAAYRDDAHLASWRKSGLSATALETLTVLWRKVANTLDELTEKLAHRGHSREVYKNALAELRERKYLTGVHSALKLTPQGEEFRQQVESLTDQLFFAPWFCLDQSEKEELAGTLNKLKTGLG